MLNNKNNPVLIPADVPSDKEWEYSHNYKEITKGSGRLMLFAGDQKIEHMNGDFFGPGIASEDSDPEHLFRIASKANIGAFATQLGLIAKYGKNYKNIPYIVKLNSKTNLIPSSELEPFSELLWTIEQVSEFKRQSGLKICGVGYTLYPGSQFESEMLKTAAQVIFQAHQKGLVVVLWIYPRGQAIKEELDPHLVAGCAGIGACLGADFLKVNAPQAPGKQLKEIFAEAVKAAGRSKIICAGGQCCDEKEFLTTLKEQLEAGAMGNATGRNIHQKPLEEAIKFCNAIYTLVIEGKSVADALKLLSK
ncbi:MAG: aldolase [Candidatus Paceibacterota bacterium]